MKKRYFLMLCGVLVAPAAAFAQYGTTYYPGGLTMSYGSPVIYQPTYQVNYQPSGYYGAPQQYQYQSQSQYGYQQPMYQYPNYTSYYPQQTYTYPNYGSQYGYGSGYGNGYGQSSYGQSSYGYGYGNDGPPLSAGPEQGIPTGDSVWGNQMCYYPGYGRAFCGADPREPVYDPWTGTWY